MVVVKGEPTFDHADLLLWDASDVDGWIDTAAKCAVRLVYGSERTGAQRVAELRQTLDELWDGYGEDFDARADSFAHILDAVLARHGTDVLGWTGAWRFGGIAHALVYSDEPATMKQLSAEFEQLMAVMPTRAQRRQLDMTDWTARQAAADDERLAKFEGVVAQLAASAEFAAATNLSGRKTVLNRMRLDTVGLNKEDVINDALARVRATS